MGHSGQDKVANVMNRGQALKRAEAERELMPRSRKEKDGRTLLRPTPASVNEVTVSINLQLAITFRDALTDPL